MGPVEALRIALSKERESIGMYKKFAEQHQVARETFEFLISEEQKHEIFINKKISELTSY